MYSLSNDHLNLCFTDQGGMLTSIKSHDGIEYLWQGDPTHWAGQAPVCFPICGGLRNGQAKTRSGHLIRLGRHGFARSSRFKLAEQTVDSLTFRLVDTLETFQDFPFSFQLDIIYRLKADKIDVIYEVTNTGTQDLPYFIGGHPAFNCPLEEGLTFGDYELVFDQNIEPQVLRNIPGGLLTRKKQIALALDGRALSLQQDLFDEGALVFEKIPSKTVQMTSTKGQHGLEISYQDFDNLLIWSSGTNAPFVAIEPWNGLATLEEESDLFEEKTGLRTLTPGLSASYVYCIRCY